MKYTYEPKMVAQALKPPSGKEGSVGGSGVDFSSDILIELATVTSSDTWPSVLILSRACELSEAQLKNLRRIRGGPLGCRIGPICPLNHR